MASVVSVLSNTAGLLRELQKLLPSLVFRQIKDPNTDVQFKESNIIIADYDLLGPHVYQLPNTKWVQGTWAGVDSLLPFIKSNQLPAFPITRFSGDAFGNLMTEYVITTIINNERDFFTVRKNQLEKKWNEEGKIRDYRAISDLTIGVMGLGNIGSRLGKNLNSLGALILGYGRNPSNLDYVQKNFTKNTLNEFLQQCDYFINTMPKTQETTGLLSGDVLQNCKERQAVFINIGRGNIVSEDSLVNALEKGWIGGAILDVFEKEPLRADSPLWEFSNVFITPHVSGHSRAIDIANQFKDNYNIFVKNGVLPNTVDFTKGY